MSSSFLCTWASWLVILPCHYTALAISSLFFYFFVTHGLTGWGSCQPTFHIFTSFGLYWATFLLCHAAHFIHRASSAHLLLYFFYFHGFLLNPLGFLSPIIISLPLITFQAYWPLCQPYEFTNSFLEFSRSIYFFFTSYYSHGFTISFLRLSWSIFFFFATYYFCGPTNHYSCHSVLLVFILLFSLPIFFILLGFFCHWTFCQKWTLTLSIYMFL